MCLSCTGSEILSLISQNVNRSRDSEHIPLGEIFRACTHTPVYQSVHEIKVPNSGVNRLDVIGLGHLTLTTPLLGGDLSSCARI